MTHKLLITHRCRTSDQHMVPVWVTRLVSGSRDPGDGGELGKKREGVGVREKDTVV